MRRVATYTEEWFPGDPIIWRGMRNLLQGFGEFEWGVVGGETERDKVIQPGTPSWISNLDWNALFEREAEIWLLGIGHYHDSTENLASEELFSRIAAYPKLRMVVARDRPTYLWFSRSPYVGPLHLMPCPGFFALPTKLRLTKQNVALDLLDPLTPGWYGHCQRDYRPKIERLVEGFRRRGTRVSLSMHRPREGREEFCEWAESLEVGKVHTFGTEAEWRNHYMSQDVYVGARVHGALPMAGSGAPSYGLGIDHRHLAWETAPFLEYQDLRYGIWEPEAVLDWYDLVPGWETSQSLIAFRTRSWNRWNEVLKKEGL